MSVSRRTGAAAQIAPPRRAPHWAVAAWRGAKVAISRLVAALGKANDEDRARDHEERVFQPRKKGY